MPIKRLGERTHQTEIKELRSRSRVLLNEYRDEVAKRLRRKGHYVPPKNLFSEIDGVYVTIKFDVYGFGSCNEYHLTKAGEPIIQVKVSDFHYHRSNSRGLIRRTKADGSFPFDEVVEEIHKVVEFLKARKEQEELDRDTKGEYSKFLRDEGIDCEYGSFYSLKNVQVSVQGSLKNSGCEYKIVLPFEDKDGARDLMNFLKERFPEKLEECETCLGHGHLNAETGEPTSDRREPKCLDCRGSGEE